MSSFVRTLCLIISISFTISSGMAQVFHRGFRMTNNRAKRVSIPFELQSNLIIIPVRVNNGEELKFILDTGVRTAILTNGLYVEGLPDINDRMITLMGAGNEGEVSAYVSNGISFALPEGVAAEGNAMLVLKEDYLRLDSYLGTRVHGILGYEIFSRFVVEIDYMRQEVVLHKPEYFKPRRRFTRVPITIEDTKPYIDGIKLSVNDSTTVDIKLMIDTGASHSLMLNTASNDSIKVPDPHLSGYLGRGLSGEIFGHMARVPGLSIQDFDLEGVISSFPEEGDFLQVAHSRAEHNGNIGGSVLKRFRVIFDYANEAMYLHKNRYFRQPFDYNMSGMELIAVGPLLETFLVSKVIDGSPADKVGIQEGDMVLSVNGLQFPELNLGLFSSMMSRRPGKRVRMKIYRSGILFKKKFRLERIL
ncbi:MAG: aspartyl protease family protein [Cyclobacteriaceae bacterium]